MSRPNAAVVGALFNIPPKHQAQMVLNQANPSSGLPYEVLATTKNVRIIAIVAKVTFTVQPTPLEIQVTIDGVVITFTKANPTTATSYFAIFQIANADTAQVLGASDLSDRRAFLMEGRSVKIEAKTTGGTVSNLNVRLLYAKY